jgi:hypothetical protein
MTTDELLAAILQELQAVRIELVHMRQLLSEDGQDGPACPHCGEVDRLQDTSEPGAKGRQTCLSCGRSWIPAAAAPEEVSRG